MNRNVHNILHLFVENFRGLNKTLYTQCPINSLAMLHEVGTVGTGF